MKITVFTSTHLRHRYLIKMLAKNFDEVLYVSEKKPYIRSKKTQLAKKYFKKVEKAEKKFFRPVKLNQKKIKKISFKYNQIDFKRLLTTDIFVKSDFFLVYGSSLLKGNLLKYLINKKALNLHMGLLPYYRETDCNFWAIHDGNINKVGASLIYLSSKIDKGDIVKTFKPKKTYNKFYLSMSACKNAIDDLTNFLLKKRKISPIKKIDKTKLFRFSSYKTFNDVAIKNYLNKKINF